MRNTVLATALAMMAIDSLAACATGTVHTADTPTQAYKRTYKQYMQAAQRSPQQVVRASRGGPRPTWQTGNRAADPNNWEIRCREAKALVYALAEEQVPCIGNEGIHCAQRLVDLARALDTNSRNCTLQAFDALATTCNEAARMAIAQMAVYLERGATNEQVLAVRSTFIKCPSADSTLLASMRGWPEATTLLNSLGLSLPIPKDLASQENWFARLATLPSPNAVVNAKLAEAREAATKEREVEQAAVALAAEQQREADERQRQAEEQLTLAKRLAREGTPEEAAEALKKAEALGADTTDARKAVAKAWLDKASQLVEEDKPSEARVAAQGAHSYGEDTTQILERIAQCPSHIKQCKQVLKRSLDAIAQAIKLTNQVKFDEAEAVVQEAERQAGDCDLSSYKEYANAKAKFEEARDNRRRIIAAAEAKRIEAEHLQTNLQELAKLDCSTVTEVGHQGGYNVPVSIVHVGLLQGHARFEYNMGATTISGFPGSRTLKRCLLDSLAVRGQSIIAQHPAIKSVTFIFYANLFTEDKYGGRTASRTRIANATMTAATLKRMDLDRLQEREWGAGFSRTLASKDYYIASLQALAENVWYHPLVANRPGP